MTRFAPLVLLAFGFVAPAAHAADRTDAIPASVGPADFRSYFVNSTANLPAGVTSDRWLAIAQRLIARWGATYSGTTTASPDNHSDRINVIGFSTALSGSTAGLNTKIKGGSTRGVPGLRACTPVPGIAQNEQLVTTQQKFTFKLRKDSVRKGKVRKRTVTSVKTVTTAAITSAPVAGERCLTTPPGTESNPTSLVHESDIQMDSSPGLPWYTGTGHPTNNDNDLESVLLHELGHAAGLSHQPQDCDPSSPMRPSSFNGEYWRGLDEVFYQAPCSQPYPVTPDPASGPEPPFAFGPTLGGASVMVNSTVPAGYDTARFVALAKSVIERWGGTFGGATAALPVPGDGVSVVGFDAIAGLGYEVSNLPLSEDLAYPSVQDCTAPAGTIDSHSLKKVTKKVRVKVRGRRRTLKLRADRIVTKKVPGVPSGSCVVKAAHTDRTAKGSEIDIGISKEMEAYELGPAHPVLQTRTDMASVLAAAFGNALGIANGNRCGGQTPVTDVEPGDWWRSATDVKRVGGCARSGAVPVRSGSRTFWVLAQE